MNNRRLKRLLIFTSMLILPIAFLVVGLLLSRSTVALVNNYKLEQWIGGGPVNLVAPDGESLSKESISQFCISGDIVYGWIDGQEAYFLLDTHSGNFQVFSEMKELNRKLAQSGIPRLNMASSFTFWDIISGYKTPAGKTERVQPIK